MMQTGAIELMLQLIQNDYSRMNTSALGDDYYADSHGFGKALPL
jgi:hypothetical protein